MSTDTFTSIWNEVHSHSTSVDPLLVQSWVKNTWREIAEARTWSWLRKKSALFIQAPYSTGTVAYTPGSVDLTFTGATLQDWMVGYQFRVGYAGHIYDITSVDTAAGTAQIWPAWSDTADAETGQSYKIFKCYLTPPSSDFFSFIAITDPSRRRRLRLHVNQETLDYYDAQRNRTSGPPACISGIDWTSSYAGKVHPSIQVVGSGPAPTFSGTYTGQTDALYVIKVTAGGGLGAGTATYQKDGGSTTSFTIDASITLPEGVGLTFPDGVYVLNNVFVVRVSPRPQYGLPRYEIYPHPSTAMVLPVTYSTRVQDIDEDDFVLPYTMRGDVIVCGALAKMARQYPGTDQKPNPYSQNARATALEQKFMDMVAQLITADDYIMETNVMDGSDRWEYSLLPWMTAQWTGFQPTAEYDPRDFNIGF